MLVGPGLRLHEGGGVGTHIALRIVQGIDGSKFRGSQVETGTGQIGLHTFDVLGLRDDDATFLRMPTQYHLCGRDVVGLGRRDNRLGFDVLAMAERAIRFNGDAMCLAEGEIIRLAETRVHFDLVHRWGFAGIIDNSLKMLGEEVADASHADSAFLLQFEQRLPCLLVEL